MLVAGLPASAFSPTVQVPLQSAVAEPGVQTTCAISLDMLTIKSWFLIVGVVLCCLGFMCFPIGYGATPKRDTSLFNNFADAGAFIHTGVALFCAGFLVIALTLLIPSLVHVIRRVLNPPSKKKLR